MKPLVTLFWAVAVTLAGQAAEPAPKTVNSIGMEFSLIPAGSFTYGQYLAPFPAGSPAASGMTAAQAAAVAKMNEGLAASEQAVAAARTALVNASLSGVSRSQLEALARALADADSTLALARAEAFAGLQKSPARLGATAITNLVQQAASPAGRGAAAAGGRGGGNPADIAKAEELIQAARAQYPGFTVKIPKPFYLGTYEVTQEQWTKIMGSNPSTFQDGKFGVTDGAKHPVDSVTWEDAQAFVKKLNALEKTNVYRLPTEFEWEYAGKAGSPDDPSWNDIRAGAVLANTRGATTMAVGTKLPNPWGLHDMLGNVWEWVSDYYNEKQYNDPKPPTRGTVHVLKGGGFLGDVKNVVYSTHAGGPADKWEVGFRIVREVR
jgi:sulfatase modifying factor 1